MGIKPFQALLERGEGLENWYRGREPFRFSLEWIGFLSGQPGLKLFNAGEDFSAGHILAGSEARSGIRSGKPQDNRVRDEVHRTWVARITPAHDLRGRGAVWE